MAVWPVTLPAVPLVEGYGEGFEDRRIVFETEYGPFKARPRTSRPTRLFQASYYLTGSQVNDLTTLYKVTTRAGELRFDWPHPRTSATVAARFVKPPTLTHAPRADCWLATMLVDIIVSPLPTGTGSLTWPSSLPQKPLIDGYGEQFSEMAVRSDLSGGAPVARRRTTAARRLIRGATVLTRAQVLTFDGFYENDLKGGSLAFTWTHPRDGAVKSVFSGGPTLRALAPQLFEVSFDLEAAS